MGEYPKAVVFVAVSKNNKILLEKKREDHPNEPGCIVLPGGHVEDGETPQEATLRELEEEFGIVNVNVECFEELPEYTSTSGKKFHLFFFKVNNWDGYFKSLDVDEVIFADFSLELIEKLDTDADKMIVKVLLGSNDDSS